MNAVLPELSVNISQKRWSCVLDPTLALSSFGLPLATRLGRVMDLWVARELWHILDNTHFYLQEPTSLLHTADDEGAPAPERSRIVVEALREWERIRLENDPGRQNCYWIGDGPMESFLPDGLEPEVVWRYEAICADLDRLLPDKTVLPSAYRDVVALAATLPSAFVLTHLPATGETGEPGGRVGSRRVPDICQVFEQWTAVHGDRPSQRCIEVAENDPWRREETDLLRRAMLHAGLGKWVWSGLRLAVLHIAAPAAAIAAGSRRGEFGFMGDDLGEFDAETLPAADYWRDAQAFWYPL
ncbi:hypothetical protein ACW73L_03720 [Methylolobus aquaticus]